MQRSKVARVSVPIIGSVDGRHNAAQSPPLSRTPSYLPILRRQRLGVHAVPMLHSSLLVHVADPRTADLSFHPSQLDNYRGQLGWDLLGNVTTPDLSA